MHVMHEMHAMFFFDMHELHFFVDMHDMFFFDMHDMFFFDTHDMHDMHVIFFFVCAQAGTYKSAKGKRDVDIGCICSFCWRSAICLCQVTALMFGTK